MKIGIVTPHIDQKNDLRLVIEALHDRNIKVVVFTPSNDFTKLNQLGSISEKIDLRIIKENKQNFTNWLWIRLFRIFGQLPKSKENYQTVILFQHQNIKNKWIKLLARIYLILRMRLPNIISYDFFLKNLSYREETEIYDIEYFLFITDICDSFFLKRVLDNKIPMDIYVYSWDHAPKFSNITKRSNYLVWNEKTKYDLLKLHNIPPLQVRVVGPSQFTFLYEYHKKLEKNEELTRAYNFKYIYFAFSTAYSTLVSQEVSFVSTLSEYVAKYSPDLKIVCRPYPMLNAWEWYDSIKALENVVFEDGYKGNGRSTPTANIMQKIYNIHHAEAVFHCGTTLGLEACFTKTPSFIIDLEKNDSGMTGIRGFVHQYQNEQYLLIKGSPNVITNLNQLAEILLDLSSENFSRYTTYNTTVANDFNIISANQWISNVLNFAF